MFSLQGKRALVTGASGGLGAHFASVLAGAGAAVTAGARRVEALTDLCETLRRAGAEATPAALDVTSAESVRAVMDRASFDIVINNAGVTATDKAMDLSEKDWDRILDTNLKGAFMVSRAAARSMSEAGRGGAIVNVASILGLRVAGQVSAYAASKAGLIQLTRSTALEWARHGIRVNALCPGYVETPINAEFFGTDAGQALIRRIPMRQLSRPEDLDGALLLLCSEAGRMITGTEIVVDGGHLVSSL